MPDRSRPDPSASPDARAPDAEEGPEGSDARALRAIVDGWPDIVTRFDAELRHVYVNRAVEQAAGLPAAAYLGRTNAEVGLPAHLCEMWSARLRRVFETGAEDAFEFEYPSPGGVRHYHARVTPEFGPAGPAGPVRTVLGVVRDVTDRVRLEARLRDAQKLDAVGRLAGGIAHDFNNLLTVITTYSHFLLDAIPEGDERRGDVLEIRGAAERATRLTRQLLAFSRRQVLQPRLVDLSAVVAAAEPLVRQAAGAEVEVVITAGAGLPAVMADPAQLEQVVVNLASNARDAMPDGGVLMLETLAAPDGSVRLVVRDTGTGMDAETQRRAVEPFFTTKPKGAGTGLGLSTAHGIVEQSGGRLLIDSAPGRGTRVTVVLPAARGVAAPAAGAAPRAPAEPAADAGGALSAAGAAGETVLVVEDEDAVRASVCRALEARGYRVLEGRDGRHGVDAARAHPGRIHLLLTDVVMPGLSGQEVAAQLTGERPDLRVVYMSGYSDDAIARRGALGDGALLLQKPFTVSALAEVVRATLDG